MSRGQFSSTSTNVVIPTIPPQYSKGLRENYMQHLWETMSGSGNSGTGAEPTPCHIHTHPTTNHTLHTQQAPRPRPRLFCPHSPICTQPTGTSRCPAPTRHLSLVPHPIYPNHQNPPRHIPAKRTQLAQPHPHLPHVHHAARPTPDAPTSHPHHSCAQNADHLTQNTPNSLNFTEVVCTLGAPIPNTANMETSARPTGLPQCPWVTEPGRTSETTHRTTRQQPAPPAWRAPEGTGGRVRRHLEYQQGLAAVPVGGGRVWPDNEPTRRAELAARTARGRPVPPVLGTPVGPEATTTRKPQCSLRPQRPRRALRAGPGRGSG